MKDKKTMIRFYTIADFKEEENWLRQEHRNGWKLTKMKPPCFFRFERCEPEDVIYRLDFKNSSGNSDYFQMFADYGWEYAASCLGWLYFRKPAAEVEEENEGEIFSDTATKIDMIMHIMKTRMLPCLVILLCCVIPNVYMAAEEGAGVGITLFLSVLLMVYLYLIIYCGIKLIRIKKEMETGKY